MDGTVQPVYVQINRLRIEHHPLELMKGYAIVRPLLRESGQLASQARLGLLHGPVQIDAHRALRCVGR